MTLQNSVGQIISGLLLLFEQPFQLGDWIDTPTARGRVLEVNWRATHIDTGSGLLIMPNSVLAVASFTNFSRPPGTHSLGVSTVFSVDDPPDDVIAMLNRVAATLPQLRPDATPSSVRNGGLNYGTGIPLRTPADDFATKSLFLRWVWYASRRAGLHLDEAEDEFATPERVEASLRIIAPTLRLSQDDQQELLSKARLTRYRGRRVHPVRRAGAQADDLPGQRPRPAWWPRARAGPWFRSVRSRKATSLARPR